MAFLALSLSLSLVWGLGSLNPGLAMQDPVANLTRCVLGYWFVTHTCLLAIHKCIAVAGLYRSCHCCARCLVQPLMQRAVCWFHMQDRRRSQWTETRLIDSWWSLNRLQTDASWNKTPLDCSLFLVGFCCGSPGQEKRGQSKGFRSGLELLMNLISHAMRLRFQARVPARLVAWIDHQTRRWSMHPSGPDLRPNLGTFPGVFLCA